MATHPVHRPMQAVPIRLIPGSDLRRSLEDLARREGRSGFVVSAVGDVSRATIRFAGQPSPTVLHGEHEIISLCGSLAPGGVHLHLSLAAGDGRVVGGHLEHGSRVHKGAEVLVVLLSEVPAEPPAEGMAAAPAVEIAVLPGCPYSARALRMLRTLGIAHTVQTVNSDMERQAVRQRAGRAGLPQVFIGGEAIGGYDALADWHGSGRLEALRGL
jgi:predicted DNA-binding protein with PD1-like motif/glutaredoxin